MTRLTFNLIQGSVSFNFPPEAARNLKQEILQLVATLKTIATSKTNPSRRAMPEKPMEYRYREQVFLEVFCNPNIYPSPYAAKVLLTIEDDLIRISSEAELSRLLEDLDRYLEQFT